MRLPFSPLLLAAGCSFVGSWSCGGQEHESLRPQAFADAVETLLQLGEVDDRRVVIFCSLQIERLQSAVELLNDKPKTVAVLNPGQPNWRPQLHVDVMEWSTDALQVRALYYGPPVQEAFYQLTADGRIFDVTQATETGSLADFDHQRLNQSLSRISEEGRLSTKSLLTFLETPLAWGEGWIPDSYYAPREFELSLLTKENWRNAFRLIPISGEEDLGYHHWSLVTSPGTGRQFLQVEFTAGGMGYVVCKLQPEGDALVGEGHWASRCGNCNGKPNPQPLRFERVKPH